MNKNVKRGYSAEMRCLQELQFLGYWVERQHKSRGTFDVIAVGKAKDIGFYTEILAHPYPEVRFIQVKRTKANIVKLDSFSNKYTADIKELAKIPGSSHVSRELWVWVDAQYGSMISKKIRIQKAGWRKFRLAETDNPIIYEIEIPEPHGVER